MLPIVLYSEKSLPLPSLKQLPILICLGLTGVFAYNVFFFNGLTHITAGRAALIIATTPLAISLASALLYKEKLTFIKISGILTSLIGALFVISNGHPMDLLRGGFGTGEQALIGCVLSWTAYTIIGRTIITSLSPLITVFYSSTAGATMLLFPALFDGLATNIGNISQDSLISLIFMGFFATTLGFTWYYKAINRIGTTRAAIFINLVPLFGLILSWLILSETIKPSVFLGGALVLLGIYVTNKKTVARKI